ncbi:MAG: protein kinase [Chloracidobacterium sp.]
MPSRGWIWLLGLWLALGGLGEISGADGEASSPSGPTLRPFTRLFTGKDGLPQVSAMSLATDAQGYLWVATQDGAARFDGRAWQSFAVPNRSRSNFLRVCLATRDGRVWFGRQDGGLACRLPDGTWENYDEAQGLPAGRVNGLLERSDGALWIGTEQGLSVWMPTTSRVTPLPATHATGRVLALAETADGLVWLGTAQGLASSDGKTCEIVANGPTGSVFATFVDGTGALWVGGRDGLLWRRESQTWQRWPLPTRSRVTALTETVLPSGERRLWIATDGDGLFYTRSDGRPDLAGVQAFDASYGLPNISVWSLLPLPAADPGRHVGLWVGTDGGLLHVSFTGWATLDNVPALAGASVYGMGTATGPDGTTNYWFGTRGKGLVGYVDGRWRQLTMADGLSTNTVFSVHESFDPKTGSTLWIGTQLGLFRKSGQGRPLPVRDAPGLEKASIRAFLASDGWRGRPGLWVVTAEVGLARFEDGQWSSFTTANGLPTNALHSICESVAPDGEKTIWVGTEGGGLARWRNGRWDTWQTPTLPNNTVMTVQAMTFPDGKQFLFAGTEGGGLVTAELNLPELRFHVWSQATTPGFPNDTVYQVQFDAERRAYALTNQGAARLTYQGNGTFTIETFDAEDGLPSGEFNGGASMVDPSGRIWGGTPNGVAVFDPAVNALPPPPRRPVLQAMTTGATNLLLTDGLTVPYSARNLTFDVSTPVFASPARLRYRTYLEGFDEQPSVWSAEPRRSFTNLWPGEYVFQAWARDGQGRESQPVQLRFRVATPWWLRWWAWVGYVGCGVGLVYGGVRWRLRALERQNAELEAKVAERTAALEAAKTEVEAQNQALAAAKTEVERKNAALDEKVAALEASQRRADRIFSALAEALPGTVLDGKYRLGEKLGAGGYGVVFAGEHLGLKRAVAVKVFKPVAGNDSAEALERFRREGALAAQIKDRHVVEVVDAGVSSEGMAYLVMELLEGYALTREVRGGVSVERALRVCGAVCRGLAAAHELGVVHRDVKPENVYVDWSSGEEVVKVVDFGIATVVERGSGEVLETLTAAGSVVGTPAYIAPERVVGGTYDGRADVYGVGVMLYEMVCGAVPFGGGGESGIRVLLAHVHEAAEAPAARVAGLDEEVSAYVLRMLAKRPEERPTAAEAAADLDRLADKVQGTTDGKVRSIAAQFPTKATLVTTDETKPTPSSRE